MSLRVITQRNGEARGHLLLDKCLLTKGNWEKEMCIKLQDQYNGTIRLELWSDEFGSAEYLQFVTGWSVNLMQWIQSGGAKRWYEVNKREHIFAEEVVSEPEYLRNENELNSSTAYVSVDIVGEGAPTIQSSELPQPEAKEETPKTGKSTTFQFVLPHRSFAKSGKLRAVRIGRIVHELRTDILHDLLPLTLYGRKNGRLHQRTTFNSPNGTEDGMMKALIMLQLSCQYANYCINELDRYSSNLQIRRAKLQTKVDHVKHSQTLLKGQVTNLQRESEVASCSLDGVQSLLQELDPAALAQLQGEIQDFRKL
ncbi:hypothetical protein V7S43_001357 [Phytophthora oleae]|uniref:C2 domain-containing protein n=1 Tax=Phytophthora oleae TaxID=2107226 RepID=A0ABD3G3W0_9STRA